LTIISVTSKNSKAYINYGNTDGVSIIMGDIVTASGSDAEASINSGFKMDAKGEDLSHVYLPVTITKPGTAIGTIKIKGDLIAEVANTTGEAVSLLENAILPDGLSSFNITKYIIIVVEIIGCVIGCVILYKIVMFIINKNSNTKNS
jgi:hypothetical protein